jgi:hypothetical protein
VIINGRRATYGVHREGHHGLGSQAGLRSLQVRLGSHLQIQDQGQQHQEQVRSSQLEDRVQQDGQHQAQQPMLRQSKVLQLSHQVARRGLQAGVRRRITR